MNRRYSSRVAGRLKGTISRHLFRWDQQSQMSSSQVQAAAGNQPPEVDVEPPQALDPMSRLIRSSMSSAVRPMNPLARSSSMSMTA